MSTTIKLKSYKMRISEAGTIPYTLQKMCQFEVDLLYFSDLKYQYFSGWNFYIFKILQ